MDTDCRASGIKVLGDVRDQVAIACTSDRSVANEATQQRFRVSLRHR